MARGEPRPANRWAAPLLAFGAILIGVVLAVLFASKPVDSDSVFGSGNCGAGAYSIVTNGAGADEPRHVHGNTRRGPTECYRAAERDLLLSAGLLVLPFAAVLAFAWTTRKPRREIILEPRQDYYREQRG